MAVRLKRLATGTVTGTATMYAPSGYSAQIDACAMTNNSGSDVTISLWTSSGGAPGQENIILKDFTVPAGLTRKAYEVGSQVIEDGMAFYAKASVDGVITLVVSGREQATA
jgi:hypothetical protein